MRIVLINKIVRFHGLVFRESPFWRFGIFGLGLLFVLHEFCQARLLRGGCAVGVSAFPYPAST